MDKSNKEELINYDLGKIPFDIRDTFYANGIKIFLSAYEFCLDFAELPPKDDESIEAIRIFVNPINFKLITELFNDQLKKYEEQFGEIKTG